MEVAELRRHFSEHGNDFGASNATEYEELADAFLGGAKPGGVHECTRKCGHIIRYDMNTQAYGIVDRDGVILTYFKPVPCSEVPFFQREAVRLSGRCHRYPNNLVYFGKECEK